MRVVRNLLTLIAIASIASLAACAGDNIQPEPVDETAEVEADAAIQAILDKKLLPLKDGMVPIPNQYIVVFHEDLVPLHTERLDVRAMAEEALISAELRAEVIQYLYNHALTGFSATLTPAQVRELALDPSVKYIEQDSEVSVGANLGSWGQDQVGDSAQPAPGQRLQSGRRFRWRRQWCPRLYHRHRYSRLAQRIRRASRQWPRRSRRRQRSRRLPRTRHPCRRYGRRNYLWYRPGRYPARRSRAQLPGLR